MMRTTIENQIFRQENYKDETKNLEIATKERKIFLKFQLLLYVWFSSCEWLMKFLYINYLYLVSVEKSKYVVKCFSLEWPRIVIYRNIL